jgi:succinoglycan biosynthesis protein ExoV
MDNSWHIYCLRGPLSADKLQVSRELAITDPAILLRRHCELPAGSKKYKFSLMPHRHCMLIGAKSWESVCNDLGIGFIDPRWSVEKVVQCLGETEILLTEAMHGAIVADALRLPWLPLFSNARILEFKWHDWCMSMGLSYQPEHTIGLWDAPSSLSMKWVKNPYIALNGIRKKIVKQQLKNIMRHASPILTNATLLEDRTEQLEERLEQVRNRECPLFLS